MFGQDALPTPNPWGSTSPPGFSTQTPERHAPIPVSFGEVGLVLPVCPAHGQAVIPRNLKIYIQSNYLETIVLVLLMGCGMVVDFRSEVFQKLLSGASSFQEL